MDLIQKLETEEIARLGKNIPDFKPGDTVVVNVNVVEGDRKRVQAYEGVVIARKSRGLNSAFIVRKISSGEGVERTFQLYSPLIASAAMTVTMAWPSSIPVRLILAGSWPQSADGHLTAAAAAATSERTHQNQSCRFSPR